jgi:hypothetical protein
MITRTHGPCIFCGTVMRYRPERLDLMYRNAHWLTDKWLDRQISFFSNSIPALSIWDDSVSSIEVTTGECSLGRWTFRVEVTNPYRSVTFDLLDPFTCAPCETAIRDRARPGRAAYEERHHRDAPTMRAWYQDDHAQKLRKQLTVIPGNRRLKA